MVDNLIPKHSQIIIILLFLVLLCLGYIIFNIESDKDKRIDRIEKLMQYSEYAYGGYSVNKNMTVYELQEYYNMLPYQGYKKGFTEMVLDYVCDGNSELIFGFLT